MYKILNTEQQNLLNELSNNSLITDNFYLSGGTALSEFHLGHRLSEDLDFFSEEEIDIKNVINIINSLKKKLEIKHFEYRESFNRNLIFIHYEDITIKTEFTYYPFRRIEKILKYNKLEIDSLRDILVNKLFTIYQKSRSRDFVDIYYIKDKIPFLLKDLIIEAQTKFDWYIDPIQLANKFQEVHTLSDLPHMLLPFNYMKAEDYFDSLSLEIKQHIFKK